MCYSAEMSAFFAAFSLVLVFINRWAGTPLRVQLCILFFGLMELLQTVQYQYLAVPEDNFAMCKSKSNQFLTLLAGIHIGFQPFFVNVGVSATSRIRDIKARHQDDLVMKLCLLGGAMIFARYLLAAFWPDNPAMANVPSEMCPNYEWVRDGYDAHLNWTTPNLPGNSCTFRPPTSTGHLA